MMITTFDDLISAFGGALRMGAALGVGRTAIANWRARGRIPPAQWPGIVDAAAAGGIGGVSYEVLRRLSFAPARRPEVAA